MARSFRCFEVFFTLKAECLQSWLLGTPEGISTRVKPGWSVSGILSLGKLDKLGAFWAEDSQVRASGQRLPRRYPPSGRQTPLTTASSPPPRPQGQVTCFVISFSFPLGPQIFLSLCIRKTDSGLRWFQLLVTKTESWCLSLQVIFCKGFFFFFFCIPNLEP